MTGTVRHLSCRAFPVRAAWRRAWAGAWLGCMLCLAGAALGQTAAPVLPAPGDPAAEKRAFDAAARAFQDGINDRAEREFADFIQKYPQSPLVPEAVLYQARAAIRQQKLQTAIPLLVTNLPKAGSLGDHYLVWQAEAYLRSSNHLAAAGTFAQLAREYTNSIRLLEAGYGEALARFRLHDHAAAIALLQDPQGTFQRAARVRANDELVVLGHLLLGEALMEQRNFKSAEQVVSRLAETNLVPEFKWRRQYLLCRIQLADHRPHEALAGSTNLVVLAASTGQPDFLAESVATQANLLQLLGRPAEALKAYTQNLHEGVPTEFSRAALAQIIRLLLKQNEVTEAARQLQVFFASRPADAASDLALLTLGEVCLKLHLEGAATNRALFPTNLTLFATNALPITNVLQAALAQFDRLLASYTNSPFVSLAQLNRGWCFWLQNRMPEGAAAFAAATGGLPLSEDLAIAHFKLADTQYLLNDYTNALRNYRTVVERFAAYPRIKNTLFDHAYYQILRVSLQLNDLSSASEAMKMILQGFPESSFRDRGLLLLGQSLSRARNPGDARLLLTELVKRMPASPLRPQVELAIARTFVQENDWSQAITRYDDWLARFTNSVLRPTTEFDRAWAYHRAGRETNALRLFTNFVARYPTNDLAPRAQFWIASYFYNQGEDDQSKFVEAEAHFQNKILQQSPELAHLALMMAGRSAFARQGWKDARDYFAALVNDNTATNLHAEAFFALGDTFTCQEADPANPLQKFDEALKAFGKIHLNYATSPLVPAAWGRMGDCYFQLASQDLRQYDSATNAYWQAIKSPGAEVGVRYQAEVKIGKTLEKMAQLPRGTNESLVLLRLAFDHYYNIVSDKSLKDGEKHDPYWYREAGLAAVSLAEEFKQWDVALNLYTRLGNVLPYLRPLLEKRIEKVRELQRLRPK